MIAFVDMHREKFGSRPSAASSVRQNVGSSPPADTALPRTGRPPLAAFGTRCWRRRCSGFIRRTTASMGSGRCGTQRHAGWNVGRDQVARLMKIAGLQGVRRGRKPVTTCSADGDDQRPDLVERRFVADRPQQLWVADITYVRMLPGSATSHSLPMSSVAELSAGGRAHAPHGVSAIARTGACTAVHRGEQERKRIDPPFRQG